MGMKGPVQTSITGRYPRQTNSGQKEIRPCARMGCHNAIYMSKHKTPWTKPLVETENSRSTSTMSTNQPATIIASTRHALI